MPLAVDLLLLDEEGRASPGSYHVSTAKGIYSELERQLQDPRSHLKRKSAFGALIERGARLRFICHDEGRNARRSPSCPAALQTPETELAASGVTAEPVSKQLASPEATEGVSAALEGRNGQRSVTVPHIADFPQSQSGKPTTDHNGNGFFSSLLNWMPSCAPVHCNSLELSGKDACKIPATPPQAMGPCVPLPASALDHSESPILDSFEVGLGGWPLCVPHVGAALMDPLLHDGTWQSHGLDSRSSGTDETEPLAVVGSQMQRPALHDARFRRAAIEVDDVEFALILAPLCMSRRNSSSSTLATPSMVSRADSQSPLLASTVLSGAGCTRLVFGREDISCVKQWPKLDSGEKLGGDGSPPFPYLVEFVGIARGVQQAAAVVLALPSALLAARCQEALDGKRPRARPAMNTKTTVGAVRCELQIDVAVQLGTEGNSANCAAVIRRGICEACHLASDRVQVRGLRDLGNDGTPVSSPVDEPSAQGRCNHGTLAFVE